MLIVVIPVIVLTLYFAWRTARRTSQRDLHAQVGALAPRSRPWSGPSPSLIILVLGILTWKTTHELDPYKPLESSVKPITSKSSRSTGSGCSSTPTAHRHRQRDPFPVGTPVNFQITSDSVMNSFFIPQLGSQIYAMAGMQTQLHLIADAAGRLRRPVRQLQRRGLLRHEVPARSPRRRPTFDAWVAKVKASPATSWTWTTTASSPSRPSKEPVKYFATVEPDARSRHPRQVHGQSSGLKLADKICLHTKAWLRPVKSARGKNVDMMFGKLTMGRDSVP